MNKAREQNLIDTISKTGFRGMDLERILNIANRYRITDQLMNHLEVMETITKSCVWETMNELIA